MKTLLAMSLSIAVACAMYCCPAGTDTPATELACANPECLDEDSPSEPKLELACTEPGCADEFMPAKPELNLACDNPGCADTLACTAPECVDEFMPATPEVNLACGETAPPDCDDGSPRENIPTTHRFEVACDEHSCVDEFMPATPEINLACNSDDCFDEFEGGLKLEGIGIS